MVVLQNKCYKYGIKDGKGTYWYQNGQKKAEVAYKDGKFIEETEWDEDSGSITYTFESAEKFKNQGNFKKSFLQ